MASTPDPGRIRRRAWRVVGGALGVALLVGCTTSQTSAPTGAAADTAEVRNPAGITDEELEGVTTCGQLHERVLAWLDAVAARALDLQGDGDALDVMVDSMMDEEGPLPGLEALEGLFPAAPYGGIAGAIAAARYEELGCTASDELPRLLEWFGVPEQARLTVEDGPLADALTARLDELGAGGFVAIGLGRRLVEGVALPGSPLMEALADVARAQEAHRAATGSYATELDQLLPHLDDPGLVATDDPDRPVVIVTAADADRYCVHGADGPSAVVESHDGKPRNRVPGTPSCPNTFPDLDDR